MGILSAKDEYFRGKDRARLFYLIRLLGIKKNVKKKVINVWKIK